MTNKQLNKKQKCACMHDNITIDLVGITRLESEQIKFLKTKQLMYFF